MSNRELYLLAAAIDYAVAYQDTCPDVGMGRTKTMIADRVIGELPFKVSETDRDQALNISAEKFWEKDDADKRRT